MILLANTLPEPTAYSAIGWVVLSLAALCVAWNQIDDFLQRRQPKPSAGEVAERTSTLFITKEQASAQYSQFDQRLTNTERDVREIRGEAKADREVFQKSLLVEVGKVHNRVNEVLEKVSQLRGEVNARQL